MQDHYAQLSPSLMLGMKLNLFHILFCFWLAILHVKGMISMCRYSQVFTTDL